MHDLYIPLLLLNLSKQEIQLVLTLYLIYENEDKKTKYTIEEIGKLIGLSRLGVENLLNKLLMRNIVGRIMYDSVISKTVKQDFDEDFVTILYDKKNPLESAVKKAGFQIDYLDKQYVLNPVIKSWKYRPKAKIISKLNKLKKVIDNKFIDYLLESIKTDKRAQSSKRLNGWNLKQAVEIFRERYKISYGNSYEVGPKDYASMKRLLEQLSIAGLHKDNLEPFFEYAFNRSVDQDYVVQIIGLKYYANEYLSNIVKNQTGVK